MALVKDHIGLSPGNYASIFLSERPLDPPGYASAMELVMAEAEKLEGFLGYESLRNGEHGIFISDWRDAACVEAWSAHGMHQEAKQRGVSEWYSAFRSVTCRVEQTRSFRRALSAS